MLSVDQVEPRFLKLDEVAAELAISWSQTYALVRSGSWRPSRSAAAVSGGWSGAMCPATWRG
jgi:hypothetical protein